MKQFSNALMGASLALACLGAFAQQAPTAPVTASAPTAGGAVNRREAHQNERIQQGVANGSISAREAYRLERQQGRIDAAEAAARSDGQLSGAERERLNRMQNNANHD